MKGPELKEDDCLEDKFVESDVVEVAEDVEDVMDSIVEDDPVAVDDVVNLNVDNVVD